MRVFAHAIALAVAVSALTSGPVRAQSTDAFGYKVAAEAIEAEDWDLAYLLAQSDGQVATDLVSWHRLRAGAGTFEDYRSFLASRPDWPGLSALRGKAELSILAEIPPADVIAFFAGNPLQTGEGVASLARAMRATGQSTEADAIVVDAWLTLGLTEEGQAAVLADNADLLASHHAARADAMLWRWRSSDAEQLLPLLSPDDRLLAEARIALIRNAPDRQTKLAAVPSALRNHPGLLYDQFNRLADSGDYSDATSLLIDRSNSAESLDQPFRWASWRATLARWAMREGRPEQAYTIAINHHLSDGEIYADLEWVAGYVSLTYLSAPGQALTHFARVEATSSGPISTSRAAYWTGRALEQMGNAAAAADAYRRAAEHQTAFYGLLATERLGRPLDPTLAGREVFPDWREAELLSGDLTRAMVLLLGADQRGSAVQFVAEQARTLDRTGLAQLGSMLAEMDEPFLTLLVGKTAAARGIVLPAFYFPLHPLTEMALPVAPELAISIARRESEFNFVVGSPVGALGLMQLMPATAEEVAGELGLPYSRARLTADWEYNAQLGSRYLANLQDRFGDSPVMIAAGYNAGPSRPATWMVQRGDPRRGEVDVIDWIEHIPFTETRNYVMRVTESIPVYHARLTGETGPVDFTALLVGKPAFVRPQARPDPNATPQPDTGNDGTTPTGTGSQGVIAPASATAPGTSLRPFARPGG